jgi:hypothetical protein
MRRAKRIGLIVAAIPALGLVLFCSTAHYGTGPNHLHFISRSPVASVSWGPANAYIVTRGVNIVPDKGIGMAGNMIEFPLSPQTRLSMRLFSFRWLEEDFEGWRSDHPWARRRCARPSDQTAMNCSPQPSRS